MNIRALLGRILFLTLSLTMAWNVNLAAQAAEQLTVLFTNDTHNRLEPFKHVELGQEVGGIVRRARYIEAVRAQNPNTLLLDAGDVFQGTPFYNFFLGEPDIRGMNLMAYDAMTVGNHDLDNGMQNLKKQTQLAHFPLLNANIIDEKTGLLAFRPFHIYHVNGLKVAVIGLMSEHAWQAVSSANKVGYRLRDPFETANELVPMLKPQVDLIISLHHMGISEDEKFPLKVPGVDLVIGGHSHTKMPEAKLIKNKNDNGIGGTLVQHAYYMGVYVGRIDLTLNAARQIDSYQSGLVLMDKRFDKQPVKDMLNSYGDQLSASMDKVIAESLDNMSTDGKYNGPFALGSLVADILRETQNAEVGIMNSGGVRSDLPKGPITVGQVYEIMPFDNDIVTFEMQGKNLQKIVQISAERLGVSKNLQFSGLKYSLKNKKVQQVWIQDQPLQAERWYRVSAPTYVFDGNEAIAFDSPRKAETSGLLIRDVLIEYLQKKGKVQAPQDQRLILL